MIGKSNINIGSNLNFQIGLAPTTPTGSYLLPDTVKENTILIESTLPFSKYSISTFPFPSNPAEGDIFVRLNGSKTSSTIEIDALRKNSVILYLRDISQYTGTSWQAVTAHIYQNGTWIQF